MDFGKLLKEMKSKYKDELILYRGKVDLVAGGPPCQGFSTAGRRKEAITEIIIRTTRISVRVIPFFISV